MSSSSKEEQSSSSSPPPPSSASHQTKTHQTLTKQEHQFSHPHPSSCSVFHQENKTSVNQEITHHQTLGKPEQSVSAAPKHKTTLLINKKLQIKKGKPRWVLTSRDTKLVKQLEIMKTQPRDKNDDMSTDEEESESAEEESESESENSEETTTHHHQTLGKRQQSVSAPKHKTTPSKKTQLINKKPQIKKLKPSWEQKSRDRKLVKQPKMKKTHPQDENDAMSTDEEESGSAEEESGSAEKESESSEEKCSESESAEQESESSQGESESAEEDISDHSDTSRETWTSSEADGEEYNPRKEMILFNESGESELVDDIFLLTYIQDFKETEAIEDEKYMKAEDITDCLPISIKGHRPSRVNVGFFKIFIEKKRDKEIGNGRTWFRNKILKMQHKYKKLLKKKGPNPTLQDFDTSAQKLHFDLLNDCLQ